MGELADQIEQDLNQAGYSSEKVREAVAEGQERISADDAITELLAPYLGAMRKAILRLAHEVDELKARS